MATPSTYTVQRGDNLWNIAKKVYGLTNAGDIQKKVNEIVKLNNISNPNYIIVGQVLNLTAPVAAVATNTSKKATVTKFGLAAEQDRTLYAVWSFDRAHTKEYNVEWNYYTKDGVWRNGLIETVIIKNSYYSNIPNEATKVRFRVKPVSATYTSNNTEKAYWSGAVWSDYKYYSMNDIPPEVPEKPTVEIKDETLSASITTNSNKASIIQFVIYKDGASFKTAKVNVTSNTNDKLVYSCTINPGSKYKVQCRAYKNGIYSGYSDWSDEKLTVPAAPKNITRCVGDNDKKKLYVEWTASSCAEEYIVQYCTDRSQFEAANGEYTSVNAIKVTNAEINITDTEVTYYVRVIAKNSIGESKPSSISSTAVGDKPAAPLAWTDVSSVEVGDNITFWWTHQQKTNDDFPTYSDLEVYVNDEKTIIPTQTYLDGENIPEDEKTTTKSYVITTNEYTEGAVIRWRVRTAGRTKEFGDWSATQLIYVYTKPNAVLTISDKNGSSLKSGSGSTNSFMLNSFPLFVEVDVTPDQTLQKVISYHVTITANERYITTDSYGEEDIIENGEIIYSRILDTLNSNTPNSLSNLEISAGDVNLKSGIDYTITCEASMDSALSAIATLTFMPQWIDSEYSVDAEIYINEDDYTASIKPYCKDKYNNLMQNALLFVYRREYDGSYTLLHGNIDNNDNVYIVDPHPALDYARYRVVAVSNDNGSVCYNDIPGIPVGCKSTIIQWDETWSDFDVHPDGTEEHVWSGSLLKLNYNIDVSDKYSPDVSLIKYIGREHPVSYYGTHVGETSTWNVVIAKDDKETLYTLRRLAKWMGDVYVREPSGTGYWANITVAFNQKHRDLTIPVTLDITRVEGGA